MPTVTDMEKKQLEESVEIPQGVDIAIEGTTVTLKGQKGQLSRRFLYPGMLLKKEDNKVIISTDRATKRENKMIGTTKAHIKNMAKGVAEGHVYKMKICSGHFPMHVSVSGTEFVIKNFFGERHPRKLAIRRGVKIIIDGNDVVLEGIDREEVAQTAADIEQITRRTKYDRRIFQDGIYITSKGREL